MKKIKLASLIQVLLLSMLLMLAGCGGSGGGTTGNPIASKSTGGIALKLSWPGADSSNAVKAAAPANVKTVRLIVLADDMETIQKDFQADAGVGVIDGIPAGIERTLVMQGLDVDGVTIYQAVVNNIVIEAGKTTELGTTDVYAFIEPSQVVADNVHIMSSENVQELIAINSESDGTNNAVLAANSTIDTGNVINVLPDSDERFPLGFAAVVKSVTTNPDGTKNAELEPATLADVAESSVSLSEPIVLNADNFVGIISPFSDEPASVAKSSVQGSQNIKSFLNGGVIVKNAPPKNAGPVKASATSSGEVNINLLLRPESFLGSDATKLQPLAGKANAGIFVKGSLKNIKFVDNHDFTTSDGLKTLDLGLNGDFQIALELSGKGGFSVASYNNAWKEVEKQTYKLLGATGKLVGLDTKDKAGKYPLLGLVWSVDCPPPYGCNYIGKTQTPVRKAKKGGVILWIYAVVSAEVEMNANVGVRANPATLNIGLTKPSDGSLKMVQVFTSMSDKLLLEAPFIDGNVSMNGKLGASVELDFFAGGVRLANTSVDIQARPKIQMDGKVSYGTYALDTPWDWHSNDFACFKTHVGAGAIFRAAINVGAELKALGMTAGGNFGYAGQWPSEEDMAKPGRHGTWFNLLSYDFCLPKPVITSVSTVVNDSKIATVTVEGSNLPRL